MSSKSLDWVSWNRAGRVRGSKWVSVEVSVSPRVNLESLIVKRSHALKLVVVEQRIKTHHSSYSRLGNVKNLVDC